ncbi:Endoplasmic reticulum mannosyl-oligosaccharide 1,2-alpha-mannosidase, partial [Rhizoclosmatium hyalinum]
MAKHAWDGYTRFAWMHDDLLPLSKQGFNWHGPGQSLLNTPIDSLDTLFLMGLMDEYNEAKELVLSHLDFDK